MLTTLCSLLGHVQLLRECAAPARLFDEINQIISDGLTVLKSAGNNGRADLLKLFMRLGPPVTARYPSTHRTVLHAYLRQTNTPPDLEVVEMLIDRGLDVNSKDIESNTPLDCLSMVKSPSKAAEHVLSYLFKVGGYSSASSHQKRPPSKPSLSRHTVVSKVRKSKIDHVQQSSDLRVKSEIKSESRMSDFRAQIQLQ